MYLVDTSVWIDFLRGARTGEAATLLALLEGEDVVGVAPIILQEVLQGADSEARFDKWLSYFEDLECYVPSDPTATHIAAARLYQRCRRAGKTPRSSNDCLIATIAIEQGLVLLHRDRDFDLIHSVLPDLMLCRSRT
jgi:predicted nucleic acid-binding protein